MGLALYARRRGGVAGATPFVAAMAAATISSLGYALQLASNDLETMLFWMRISHLGLVVMQPAALILVIQYTGRGRRLNRGGWLGFFLVPAVSLILLWTNDWHALYHQAPWVDQSGAFPILRASFGPWFWVQNAYAYLIMVAALVLMIQFLLNAPRAYRTQALLLLLGGAPPFLASFLYLMRIGNLPLDLTPFVFPFSGLLIGWGLFRYRLLDLMPVARDQLVESMEDAVMVLDEGGRVLYLNPASERLLKRPASQVIGREITELLPTWLDLLGGAGMSGQGGEPNLLLLGEGQEKRCLYPHLSPLDGPQGRPIGKLLVLHDVTARQRVEEASLQHSQFLVLLNEIIRAALDATDLVSMGQVLADRLGELMGADACYITLWDGEQKRTRPLAAYGASRGRYRPLEDYEGELTLTESALRAERPLVIEDVRNSPEVSRRIAELGSDHSVLVLPLIAGGRKIGAALVGFNSYHGFGPEEVAKGEQVAATMALAMAKVQALEEAEAGWWEAEALRQAAAGLSEMGSLDEILSRILEQLERVVRYDSATVQLLRPGYTEIVSCRGFREAEAVLGARFPVPGNNPNTMVIEGARPLVLDDVRVGDTGYRDMSGGKIRSWLALPLTVRERVIGMLTVDSVELKHFGQREVELVSAFAGQAAVAIENSRLVAGLEAEVEARTADIAEEKEKVEAILRSVADAICLADRDERIQYVNHAFSELTGYELDEVVGAHVESVGAKVGTERERLSIRQTLTQGKIWRGEATGQRKDGRRYEALLTVASVMDSEGRLLGFVSTHQDITRIKELERARSRFLTNISHELRTPVTGISLYTQLLSKGQGAPEKTDRYLQELEAQVARLQALVQDIIEMTALDSGGAVERWELIQWGSLIRDLVERFEDRASEAGLALVGHGPSPGLPAVRGDPKRLSQALGELVENAVNFSAAGGEVAVWVEAAEVEGAQWVRAAVQDQGVGVAPEEQALIFDRLYRGRPAESGKIPGTGLGLSMAQLIAEAHGGRITVESALGRGSLFSLWLRADQ